MILTLRPHHIFGEKIRLPAGAAPAGSRAPYCRSCANRGENSLSAISASASGMAALSPC